MENWPCSRPPSPDQFLNYVVLLHYILMNISQESVLMCLLKIILISINIIANNSKLHIVQSVTYAVNQAGSRQDIFGGQAGYYGREPLGFTNINHVGSPP